MIVLKPCPFCGSKDVSVLYNKDSNALYIGNDGSVRHTPLTHIIKCQCCETQTGDYEDVMMAIAAWNRRTASVNCEAAEHDGSGCLGYSSLNDDEPIDLCKRCEKYTGNRRTE